MGSVYGAEFEANRRSTSNDVQDIDGFVASLVQDSSIFFLQRNIIELIFHDSQAIM